MKPILLVWKLTGRRLRSNLPLIQPPYPHNPPHNQALINACCFVSVSCPHRGATPAVHAEFSKPDSTIRVLVCTVAFGMGVAWGRETGDPLGLWKVRSLMTFWQEVGRCGRDGESFRAIWYPKSVGGEDKALLAKIRAEEDCVGLLVLQAFKLPQM